MNAKTADNNKRPFRDKQVDKLLQNLHYNGDNIFYSSAKTWFIWIPISVLLLFFVSLQFIHTWETLDNLIRLSWPLFLLYFVITYLVSAYFNNSFALADNKIFIVNPSFPFRHQSVIQSQDIIEVKIDRLNLPLLPFLLVGIFGRNYVEISTFKNTLRYYCVHLFQSYDYGPEYGSKTIDDLFRKFKDLRTNVIFNDRVD